MRKSVRAASALLAGALAAGLALINAGPACRRPDHHDQRLLRGPRTPAPKRWVAANPGDGRAAAINASIANTPMARWFGYWSGDIGTATGATSARADSGDKLPILVAYNIYSRDYCGGHSGGGAGLAVRLRDLDRRRSPAGSATARPSSSSNRTPSATTAA